LNYIHSIDNFATSKLRKITFKMRIGLFFGSFNPVHVGHLVIANYMSEFTDLDNVWFVVSPHNPLKDKSTLLNPYDRLDLVRRALRDYTSLTVTDIEFKLPQPSYTIDTLIYLKDKYPDKEFALIMGSDNLETIPKWKNFEQLIGNYHIYVYPRPNSDGGELKTHPNVHITEAPYMQISSSFIRKSIKEKKDVQYYMPEKVSEYVSEMHLYEK